MEASCPAEVSEYDWNVTEACNVSSTPRNARTYADDGAWANAEASRQDLGAFGRCADSRGRISIKFDAALRRDIPMFTEYQRDRTKTNVEALRDGTVRDASCMKGHDLSNKMSCSLAELSRWNQSGPPRVFGICALRDVFEVAEYVVGLNTVPMVDGQPASLTEECACYQAMNARTRVEAWQAEQANVRVSPRIETLFKNVHGGRITNVAQVGNLVRKVEGNWAPDFGANIELHWEPPIPGALRASTCDAAPALILQEIMRYDWPIEESCQVSFCESRWQADAIGGDNYGLFQLWGGWAILYGVSRMELLQPATNVRIGYLIWRDHGRWSAWSCQPW